MNNYVSAALRERFQKWKHQKILDRCSDTFNLGLLLIIVLIVLFVSVIHSVSGSIEPREWRSNPYQK